MSATHFTLLLIELSIVSMIDIKIRKISNIWSIINILYFLLIFLLSYFFSYEIFDISLRSFQYPGIILITGFILYRFKVRNIRVAGAGDVKFLTTFMLLIPRELQESYLLSLLQVTIIYALINILISITQNIDKILKSIKIEREFPKVWGSKIPYAPVFLISWGLWGWFYLSF
jgi:prepilin peptidase CpaA